MRSANFTDTILCLVGARSVPRVRREILKIKEPPLPGNRIVLPESLNLFFPPYKCVHVAGLTGSLPSSL